MDTELLLQSFVVPIIVGVVTATAVTVISGRLNRATWEAQQAKTAGELLELIQTSSTLGRLVEERVQAGTARYLSAVHYPLMNATFGATVLVASLLGTGTIVFAVAVPSTEQDQSTYLTGMTMLMLFTLALHCRACATCVESLADRAAFLDRYMPYSTLSSSELTKEAVQTELEKSCRATLRLLLIPVVPWLTVTGSLAWSRCAGPAPDVAAISAAVFFIVAVGLVMWCPTTTMWRRKLRRAEMKLA